MTTGLQKTQPMNKITGLNNLKKNTPHSEYIARFEGDIGIDTPKLMVNYV